MMKLFKMSFVLQKYRFFANMPRQRKAN